MSIVAALLAFGIAWGGSIWLASLPPPIAILDKPNERSLHSRPVPRTGGLAILAGIAVAWSVQSIVLQDPRGFGGLRMVVAAAVLIAVVSFLDDLREVPSPVRLFVHIGGAMLLWWGGLFPSASWWGGLISALVVVWSVNLYNFLDGMDGFASGMGVFGFGFLALAGWCADAHWLVGLAGAVAAANSGFLVVNFPPARIFMGDTGSATMGVLAVALAFMGIREKVYQFWVPILVFSPFIVDGTVTLLRRILMGEKFWMAHRSHFYQRLVQLGWGHRKTVLVEYILMSAVGISALYLKETPITIQVAGLLCWSLAYILLILALCRLERQYPNERKHGYIEKNPF